MLDAINATKGDNFWSPCFWKLWCTCGNLEMAVWNSPLAWRSGKLRKYRKTGKMLVSCQSSGREVERIVETIEVFLPTQWPERSWLAYFSTVNEHLTPVVLPETQCGFRSGRLGTVDMTFCLHQLQRKCIVQNVSLYAFFYQLLTRFWYSTSWGPMESARTVWMSCKIYHPGEGTAQRNASTCGWRKLHLQGICSHKRCQARLRVRSDTVLSKKGWRNTTLRYVAYPQQLCVNMNQCP